LATLAAANRTFSARYPGPTPDRQPVHTFYGGAQLFRAETTSREQALQAASDERARIARELHDIVAHSMSVMVVQAGGARRILDRDPGRALEAASRIERTGREALGEMRHLLGVLGTADQPAARAPQPTLAEIGELVTRARAAGLPTVLEVRGTRRPLAPGLDLAAYRIVQEALTNALKHAGHAPVPCGSKAVREAIERYQPVLSLHGHIHEARGNARIGKTLCINPGSSYEQGELLGALVDLDGGKKVKNFVLTSG